MTEDRELVALLKAGYADALEQLITRWRSRAEAYAVSILHDPQTAEDAVQEAFSRIYAARASLDEDRSFPAYLYTIVKRICFDELRKQRRFPELPGDALGCHALGTSIQPYGAPVQRDLPGADAKHYAPRMPPYLLQHSGKGWYVPENAAVPDGP